MEIRDTRNGEWHWVYNALLADPHLTAGEKLVYSAISTFGGHQVIHPTKEQLSERCGLDAKTVQRSLIRLEEIGYLGVERSVGRGNANVYFLLKKSKGCNLCPFIKGDIEDNKRGQINPLLGSEKGTETTPYKDILYKDKQKDIALPNKLGEYDTDFLKWYELYPKKVGKPKAHQAWKKIKPNLELKRKMVLAVLEHCKSRQWQNEDYIPYPATWLNQERWNDKLPQDE